MEKTKPRFPWYFICTPIATIAVSLWYWCVSTGDNSMDILERILDWLNVNDRAAAAIVIVCFAAIGVGYMIVRWFFTNARLKNIENVANSAPSDIKGHIDTASQTVCHTIQSERNELTDKLAAIRATTDNTAQQINFLTMQRPDVPVQQGELIGLISSLYTKNDQQSRKILYLERKVQSLEKKTPS